MQNTNEESIYIKSILLQSPLIIQIVDLIKSLNLPDCWLAGGAIRCTIWNQLHGYDFNKNIKDIDIMYYSEDTELYKFSQEYINEIPIEIKNQAYIHNWYTKHYNVPIEPLNSVQDGFKYWTDTCSSTLIRPSKNDIEIVSFKGLGDLTNGIIRPLSERLEYGLPSSDYRNRLIKWDVVNKYPKIKILY